MFTPLDPHDNESAAALDESLTVNDVTREEVTRSAIEHACFNGSVCSVEIDIGGGVRSGGLASRLEAADSVDALPTGED